MTSPANPVAGVAAKPAPRRSPRSWDAVALVWGFAEATFFFIVPDIFLSWVALHDRRAAFRGCLWAAVGALFGGIVMLTLGRFDPAGARTFLEDVPAISPALVDRSAEMLDHQGSAALFTGMLTGKPYKVFAMLAGAKGLSLPIFLTMSLAARLLRFGLVTALVAWLAHGPLRALSPRRKLLLYAVAWTTNYAIYFTLLGF
jgi:membrane protein YqaA with SNARE-associated domain